MGAITQTLRIGRLMSLPSTGRYGSLVVVILSAALVVGVLASLMSVLFGYEQTARNTATEGVFLMLSEGVQIEAGSAITLDEALILDSAAGLMERDGNRVMSKELVTSLNLISNNTGERANVRFRGVMMPSASSLSDSFQIVEGRTFETGLFEAIVGRRASLEFENLQLGGRFNVLTTEWTVVGIFEDGGGISESEAWGDVDSVRAASTRGPAQQQIFTVVRVRVAEDDSAEQQLLEFLENDDRLAVAAHSESEYYAERLPGFVEIIGTIGYPLIALMSAGSIIALLNTFYSALAQRKRHYVVLRALGFNPLAISASMILEALSLALIGGAIAAAAVFSFLNGTEISVMDLSGAQMIFDTALTWQVLASAVGLTCVIAVIGSLLPAIGAARKSVIDVLQER